MGKVKTTRIMMVTVPHVTSGSGLKNFQADGFLLDRVYIACLVLFSSYLLCAPRRSFLKFVLSVIVDAFLVISFQALAQLTRLVVNSTISPSVAIKCGEFFD